MARITIEDCLKRVPNRFLLVNMAARRVRQIREGSEYLVSSPKNEDIVVSLREIAAGKIKLSSLEEKEQLEQAGTAPENETVEAAATQEVSDETPKTEAVESEPEAASPASEETD